MAYNFKVFQSIALDFLYVRLMHDYNGILYRMEHQFCTNPRNGHHLFTALEYLLNFSDESGGYVSNNKPEREN